MNQLLLGYIPKNWKDDDNINAPGYITTGDEDSGTIFNSIDFENIYDDDDNAEICINSDVRMSLDDNHFHQTFKDIADKYFAELQKQHKNLDVASALRAGWYILDDDWIEDDMLKDYGLSKITRIDADGGEFKNPDGKYNGCMYLGLRNDEEIENGDDGLMFILEPLKK